MGNDPGKGRAGDDEPTHQPSGTPGARLQGETTPRAWKARWGLPWSYLVVLAAWAVLVLGVVVYHLTRLHRNGLAHWQERQSSQCEDRARLVSNWLEERRADAEVLAALPTVKALLSDPSEVEPRLVSQSPLGLQILSLFRRFTDVYGYANIYLLDSQGRTVIRSTGSVDLSPQGVEVSRAAAREGRFRVHLLGDAPASSRLVFAMPVVAPTEREATGNPGPPVIGVITLVSVASKGLFPFLTAESVPTRTGESLLVRQEGNELVYISPLHHAPEQAAYLRRPLDSLPAAAIFAREKPEGELLDYRGVPVVAAARWIPLTGWILVRKVDRREALADFYSTARLEGVLAILAILAFGGLLQAFRRRQVAHALQVQVERQQAILKLKEYAQEIVDSVPAGLLVLSTDLRVLSCNQPFLKMYRLNREEVVGRPLEEVVKAESPPYRVASALEGESVPQSVLLEVAVGGREQKQPARISITNIAPENGEERLLLVVEDQTQSERLRGLAEASEYRLRDLVQGLDVIVWEADPEIRRFTFVSQRAEEILGYPLEVWMSEPDFWMKHLDPADREQALACQRRAVSEGQDYELEYRLVAADGHTVWLRDKVRVVKDREGQARQLRGLMLDMSARKRAEEERARLSSAVEQAAEAIVITDRDAMIQYVNPAFEQVTGYRREEVLGQNPRLLKSGKQDAAFYLEMWSKLTRGEAWSGYFSNKRKDGTLYEAEATISPVRDATGQVVNYVAVERDVTRERQLEHQLLQVQKMEAIGQLAGGVAHDFNNLLTIITGYSELALDRLEPDAPQRGYLNEIKKAGDRATSLTRQLLAFGRRQVLAPQVLDLNSVVSNMGRMLRRVIGEDIELVTILPPDLGTVRVDPGQIEQVILNLALNARDAMPQGGKLTIETSKVDLDQAYIGAHAGIAQGPYVLLAISDTGCGMDAETQRHIFEPFFTTKEQGKGTGLGLATVYGIIKQSGGYIWVYSEPGGGTSFKIYFPRLAERAAEVERAKARSGAPGGSETVLLVEDEGGVRSMVRRVLESSGYTVLEARDGDDALIVCEQHKGPIHLLVTDVVMPGLSGRELAEHLAPFYRAMKVLYISGYTDDAILHHGHLEADMHFLQKPFTPNALARKVREVLDAG
jgi:PAS domain S-box-containing protein